MLAPTSGRVVLGGQDIHQNPHMPQKLVGICPQHDILWEGLTGAEMLRVTGRVKGLWGMELVQQVEDALRGVGLFVGGAGEKLVGSYSGGMKRRLSVAAALMGRPRVVFLDEPSTGLDPGSRRVLWTAIRNARQGRAVVLTTHSMEEATELCDRIGIFVAGGVRCIGSPQELVARYHGCLHLVTSLKPGGNAAALAEAVVKLWPMAQKIASIAGSQQWQLPASCKISLSDVFVAMRMLPQEAVEQLGSWSVASTTLEQVFQAVVQQVGQERDGLVVGA